MYYKGIETQISQINSPKEDENGTKRKNEREKTKNPRGNKPHAASVVTCR
jgi:hypothetical protein